MPFPVPMWYILTRLFVCKITLPKTKSTYTEVIKTYHKTDNIVDKH
jgi:hypothetical protein